MGTCVRVLSSELRMVSILLGSSFRMFELSHLPLLSVLSCTSRIVDDVATYILSFGY